MPLPELLGIEVRSGVSSGHCHLPSASQHLGIEGRTTREWSRLSPTCVLQEQAKGIWPMRLKVASGQNLIRSLGA